MSQPTQVEFGRLRSFFWPVHTYELKKLLPMLLIFFCISFNYTVLRDTKDTLVVTSSGAETIPFLKFWGVVPAAIIFMLIYSKLSNMLSKPALFYVTLVPFLVFFGAFAFYFYPNRDLIHPTASADYLESILPAGLGGLIACYRNWTYSLFYILAELWGSAVLSLMFWGFANDITRVMEAKRFYSLFGVGANIALLCSGPAVYYFSNIRKSLPADVDAWQVSLNYLMGMVMICGIVIVITYWWMQRNILTDPRFYDSTEVKKSKKDKPKMGVLESFAFLARSPYILCLATIVMAYGVCINLAEVTWKGQIKVQYPSANDYNAFMGIFSTVTGAVTIVMLFVGGYIIRRKGWGFAAMTTPTVLLITGVAFFVFVIFRDSLAGVIAMLNTTPVFLAVLFGMFQNIASKSTKYSLFDPTKEMAYIPLDQESKVKGKAAIDVVGARLGKSGGSLIQQALIVALAIGPGQITALAPYLAGMMVLFIGIWMFAVRALSHRFTELTEGKKQPEQPAPVAVSQPTGAAPAVS